MVCITFYACFKIFFQTVYVIWFASYFFTSLSFSVFSPSTSDEHKQGANYHLK